MDQYESQDAPSERNSVSRPQIYVHLEFGVSWSPRHTPRAHTMTYTSRNLRDSRARNNFPRQLPPPNANFLTTDDRQDRSRESQTRLGQQYQQQQQQQQQYHQQLQDQRPRGHGRPLEQGRHQRPRRHDPVAEQNRSRPEQSNEQTHERRESRSESRGLSHERGKSAPPPFHDSPWDATPGPSASLFPPAASTRVEQPRIWKPLPAAPSDFRLGEDGLPWSAWAWPVDPHGQSQSAESEDESPYVNHPTTVPISPQQGRSDDPDRARELESLGAAMVTVDNGFENQWWHQGPRETISWWPRDQEEPSRLNMADALLLSSAEPPVNAPPHGWYAPTIDEQSSYLDGIVSPISTASPARPLQRSMTTRSEELFISSAR